MRQIIFRLQLVTILLLTLMAIPALAGLGYTVSTTIERADETKRFGEQVLTEGNNARIDFLDADGKPGGSMEGHETTHIRVVTKYGATARTLFMTFEYEVEEVDDFWMASDFELPVFERLWLESNSQTGVDYLDEISTRRTAFETGPRLPKLLSRDE